MRASRRPWGLLVVPLLLAGCGTSSAVASGQHAGAPPAAIGSGAHGTTQGGPPENARMICSDEIKGKVAQALQLSGHPATRDSWTPPRYTCDYRLPAGPMTLSVEVSPSNDAARGFFEQQRGRSGQTESVDGLGERAYGNRNGTVVVGKDNMTLTVDATALPATFGDNGQQRFAFAYEVASLVLGCWTGDE